MLTDPDATQLCSVLEDVFSKIARHEQNLHAHRRTKAEEGAAGGDTKGDPEVTRVDLFLSGLEEDLAAIADEIDGITIPDEVLTGVPEMNLDQFLDALKAVREPNAEPSAQGEPPKNELARLVVCAQLIDTWLEPAFNYDMKLNEAQAHFRDAFDIDGHVKLQSGAIILPRRRESWRIDEEDVDCAGIFSQNLRALAYIPSSLDCDNPDQNTTLGEPISAGYRLWNSAFLSANPLPQDPKIAVAPLAEKGSDVSLALSECRSKYSINLHYGDERFATALQRALRDKIHVLLIPEMALPEGNPDDFDERMRGIFEKAKREHYEESGSAGELRLVVAGVLGGMRADGYHRNYSVVFDGDGNQPDNFKQLKLSHWNLSKRERDLFGVTYHHPKGNNSEGNINENSLPADCLTILDIPGIGRTATLICADMDRNNPGDWLSINAILDWLHAPIMDKSICWKMSDERKATRAWIVRRTYRSARLTRTLVIATNSIALSRWVNEENLRTRDKMKDPWPLYEEVGIGLAIDGRMKPPTHDHLLVDVNATDVLKAFSQPHESWGPYPTPGS